MSHVIVTGGAGFIGSHLAEELSLRGHKVTIIDNLSSGRVENILGLLSRPPGGHVRFVRESVTNLRQLRPLFQNTDYVFHLAAIASVPSSVRDPVSTHDVNLTGTLNVLIAAKDNGVKKVIYASSSAVYGAGKPPHSEKMSPAPQSPYAVTKLAGEYYCKVFQEIYGLQTVCLRFFNVYGPRQSPHSDYAAVIPKFIAMALEGKPPIIFGNGEQTRDFIFVRDVVAATIMLAETDASGIFNIGSGQAVTINELVRLILNATGNGLSPLYENERPGDIVHSLADITKVRKAGFSPNYCLEEGLEATASWMVKFIKERSGPVGHKA